MRSRIKYCVSLLTDQDKTNVMLRIFRQIALWEAISTVILFFVAMPLKYLADLPEAVKIAGSIHGFLVVLFVVLLIASWQTYNWHIRRVALYFVVSLIPIVSFWIERDLKKIIEGEKQ